MDTVYGLGGVRRYYAGTKGQGGIMGEEKREDVPIMLQIPVELILEIISPN